MTIGVTALSTPEALFPGIGTEVLAKGSVAKFRWIGSYRLSNFRYRTVGLRHDRFVNCGLHEMFIITNRLGYCILSVYHKVSAPPRARARGSS